MIAKYKCHFGVYLSKSMVLNIFHCVLLLRTKTNLSAPDFVCFLHTHRMLNYIQTDFMRYWDNKRETELK